MKEETRGVGRKRQDMGDEGLLSSSFAGKFSMSASKKLQAELDCTSSWFLSYCVGDILSDLDSLLL